MPGACAKTLVVACSAASKEGHLYARLKMLGQAMRRGWGSELESQRLDPKTFVTPHDTPALTLVATVVK